MDSFLIGAGISYTMASILCAISLAIPEWVVSTDLGDINLGLFVQCQQIFGREEQCRSTESPIAWTITTLLIIAGMMLVSIGAILVVLTRKQPSLIVYPKYFGVAAGILFCLAIVLFPAGFDMPVIGGTSFLLPSTAKVGMSYGLFCMAIACTMIGSALALGKMYYSIIIFR
ncbi:modulator of smoothened protein-like [Antedon mediterranea]|uniref:modulator of smoothened protein-like n=1 Tax=Antedon mediterranea TaxID=105859 RepID=UPI003AF40B68